MKSPRRVNKAGEEAAEIGKTKSGPSSEREKTATVFWLLRRPKSTIILGKKTADGRALLQQQKGIGSKGFRRSGLGCRLSTASSAGFGTHQKK
jgi:hypothetical protein